MLKQIGIQGGLGAFHEIAAKKYFNNIEIDIISFNTFDELLEGIKGNQAFYGIMAIENSVAGGILPNYTLLREYDVDICGEVYLRIEHNLLALQNQSINDIKEVHSHPMAILQCRHFFKKYPHIKLIESIDTALSAKYISDNKIKRIGAIASKLASQMYNLEILYRGIETHKKNFTRFLILTTKKNKKEVVEGEINKSSIYFTLPHEEGSLSQVLSVLAFYKMNLSKIQSLPIVGELWEYLFYADLVFDDYEKYKKSLDAIKPLTRKLEILGEYEKGDRPGENR